MFGFIYTVAIDLLLLPLTLIATGIYSIIDVNKSDLNKYDSKKKTIILLHGSGNNQSEWIIGRFYLKNYNILSFNYAGLFSNDKNDGIEDYANGKVRDKINEYKQITGCNEFIIIGHSLGGLIGLYYAINIADIDGINITKIITIASPLQGAPLAKYKTAKRYKQMSYNSTILLDLINNMKNSDKDIYCIASEYDWAVPFSNGLVNGMEGKQYKFHGHYSLIISPLVWRHIMTIL
jgi:pimeloyl-ACP methyl ester carboxylesterase